MDRDFTQSQWDALLDSIREEERIALSELMSPNDIEFDRILDQRIEHRLMQEALK